MKAQHQNRRQQVPAAGQQAACFDRDGRQDFHVRQALDQRCGPTTKHFTRAREGLVTIPGVLLSRGRHKSMRKVLVQPGRRRGRGLLVLVAVHQQIGLLHQG